VLNVTALRRMTRQQELPDIAGHERRVETTAQAGAIRQSRVDELGD